MFAPLANPTLLTGFGGTGNGNGLTNGSLLNVGAEGFFSPLQISRIYDDCTSGLKVID